MRERSGQDALLDRTNLDARITFVSASFLLAYAFSALLDRVGAPERFVGAAPPYFTIVALAALGFVLHSMRVSLYYTAGRAVPACYAGFANAAIVIALILPFAARLAGRSWGFGVVGGAFLGLAGAAFYLGPLLRKTSVFSISGLLAARFPGLVPRLGLISAVALSSALVALAGGQIAVEALVELTGASRIFAAFIVGAACLLITGPGGLAGVVWAAAASAGVAVLGFGWPLAALIWRGDLPSGLFSGGEGWRQAADLLGAWRVMPAPMGLSAEVGATIAVALGVASLAPALAPAVTTASAAGARRAGFAAFAWTIVFALLVAAIVATSALGLARLSGDQPPERLPESVYSASARGLVSICGAHVRDPSAARRACAAQGLAPGGTLRAADVRPVNGGYLLGALPATAELGAAASGLLASALIALGLTLATSGLQACATAVGHEALYRMRGEIDLTSRRLAVNRLTLVAVSALGYLLSAANLSNPGALIAVGLAISAACVAPAVALAFWPRAGDREALVAICGGIMGLALALAAAEEATRVEVFALAGLAGATLGLAMGAVSGFSARDGRDESAAFVNRMLHGDGQILEPDKGA